MKVLVIGHSSYDISCPVDEYPVENTKYRLSESITCGGGPAGNAAYLLGKWGIETYYAGVVGADDFGTKIKKEFDSVGVHTDYLETNYEKPTSMSFIMINKKNGSRTLFNIANERAGMKKTDFTVDPDVILIDGHEYNGSLAALNKYPNAISIIDAGRITPELKELCKSCKYIVSSKGFAETMSGMKFDFSNPNTLVQIYTSLKNKYPKSEIVVTLEDKGALYAVNNEIKIMPGIKVTPTDTTGAGDIFHGAFTYAIAKGFDIEKCVRFANITAGLSVQKIGARLSIPSITEVNNYYNEKFPQNPVDNVAPSVQGPNVNVNQPVQSAPAVEAVQTPIQQVPVQNAPMDAVNQTVAPVNVPNVDFNAAQAAPVQQPQGQQIPVQNVANQTAMNYEQAMQAQSMNNNINIDNGGNING